MAAPIVLMADLPVTRQSQPGGGQQKNIAML